jgi:bacterioferritin (cytochrome b1)
MNPIKVLVLDGNDDSMTRSLTQRILAVEEEYAADLLNMLTTFNPEKF